jgi:molybdate transport system substrate-binding protein
VRGAWKDLVPQFERASGHRLDIEWAGIAAIRKRIGAGETFDLVVASAECIDDLIGQGRLAERIDLVRAETGVGVRRGERRPDLSSTEALKGELRAAKKVGYSTGPSGVHVAALFKRWGMEAELAPKLLLAPSGVMVGTFIASGEVEFGFQQKSELIEIDGVDYVGPLPADIACTTFFSAGLPRARGDESVVRAWIGYLTAAAAVPALRKHGLEPAAA